MDKMQAIREKIDSFARKHEAGFTRHEIVELCKDITVDADEVFWQMGVNTVAIIDGDIVTYPWDVEMAIMGALEQG